SDLQFLLVMPSFSPPFLLKRLFKSHQMISSASLRWVDLLASYLDLFDHALKGCLQSIYHAYHGFNTSAVFVYSAGKKVFLNDSIASFISSASGSCPVSRIDASNSLRFVSSHTWNSSSKRTISETAMSSKKPFVKA